MIRDTVAIVRPLPAGAIVRLDPVRGAEHTAAGERAIDGLWREALRQSAHLDIAAGPTRCSSAHGVTVTLSLDRATRSLTASLTGEPGPLHLASVVIADDDLLRAIDELALRSRLALGDPVTTTPMSLTAIYTTDLELVSACESAIEQVGEGDIRGAVRRLQSARRRDGGCTILLDALAAAQLGLGDSQLAERLVQEALQLRQRLAPTTLHRLLRTLLLARATARPDKAATFDAELAHLAEVAHGERPHDPEPLLTRGLAANFARDFATAREVLTPLAGRLPQRPTVHYHLGWSRLALGDGKGATRAFADAADRLPLATTVVPRALAFYTAGDDDALEALLAGAADELARRDEPALHQIRRMQAAHALLRGDAAKAGDLLLADLAWLLEQPSRLRYRAGEIADIGEVLVRLGRSQELQPLLFSMQRLGRQLGADMLAGDAVAYLIGLAEAARSGERQQQLEEALIRRGASVWGHALAAFGHHQQGELADERTELGRCAQQSSSPLVKAALIRNLRESGRHEEATTLRETLRQELQHIDLRRRLRHPLLAPEYALASLIE